MSTTTADALKRYHKANLPQSTIGMKPLAPDTLEALEEARGYADPLPLAEQLSAALRVLWTAMKSGEVIDRDAEDTVYLLSEIASLVAHAADAKSNAEWWLKANAEAVDATDRPSCTVTAARAGETP